MPMVFINTVEGTLNQAQKNEVVDAVTKVLVNMGVLLDRVNIIFNQISGKDWAIGGKFQVDQNKPPAFAIVDIFPELFLDKQRKDLVNALTAAFTKAGFFPDRTHISLKDNYLKNWCVAGIFQSQFADKIPPLK